MNLHSCSPFPPLSMANKAGSAILYLTLAAPAGPKTRIEFYGYRLCLANQNGAHGRRGQGGSKVRPVAGTSCSAALKSEDRRPKPESRPKSEFREWSAWGATRRRAAPGQRGGQSGADHYRGTAAAGLAGGGLARPAQYGPFTAIPAGPAERSQERAKILARGVFLDIGLPTGRRKVRPIHCRTRRQQILTNSTIFLSFV